MIDCRRSQSGFTLLEVVATLLLVAIGVTSVLGMSRLAVRWSGEAIAAATGVTTAEALIVDAQPGGRTADPSDADGDKWGLVDGAMVVASSGDYAFTVAGIVNGYYVRRAESSVAADVIDGHGRYADVSVDLFWGSGGRYVTGLKRRIIRRY
jgi:prepilin-type N-terminal cleavage/methylation domain-containing protein